MQDITTPSTLRFNLEEAQRFDAQDPLKNYRERFYIPSTATGEQTLYFCGNSLGLQPKSVKDYLQEELYDWARLGVDGHTHAKHPWMPYHEFLTEKMAKVVGAKPKETVVMNTLTANLHFMMVSFYRPTPNRYKILIESDAFPSDRYAVASQAEFHGFDPKEAVIEWKPAKGKSTLDYEHLEALLKEHGESIALVMIGAVNYYTGQYFDLKRIVQLAKSYGCMVGFDAAHGAGNVELDLNKTEADFCVWCTYKYLNSGPGSLAGCFVNERHANDKSIPRFEGWWGHNKQTRFYMRDDFEPIVGAEAWQLSNPPILSMAAIRASLDIFDEAGFQKLREKSVRLTNYLEALLLQLPSGRIKIITPNNPTERGCQLSIAVSDADKSLFEQLTQKGVVADWREPDVIRVAPVPLYNCFEDCYRFVEILKTLL